MSLHLLAYAGAGSSTPLTQIPAIPDVITRANGNYILSQNVNCLAAYVQGAHVVEARINTPSLRSVVLPRIRPINVSATVPPIPAVEVWNYSAPLMLRGNEEIRLEGDNDSTTDNLYVGLVISDTLQPAPQGPVYTLEGTSGDTATVDQWTQIGVTWLDTLAAGNYALVGLNVVNASGVFCRAFLPNGGFRPGGLCSNDNGYRTHPIFEHGNLGTWLTFNAFQMFNVEVLCSAGDTSHTVYAQLVKVG